MKYARSEIGGGDAIASMPCNTVGIVTGVPKDARSRPGDVVISSPWGWVFPVTESHLPKDSPHLDQYKYRPLAKGESVTFEGE